MDYGKFVFEQNKKAQSARRKQKQIQVKEMKFRPGTEEGDYQVKLRNLIKFLTQRRQGQGHAAVPRTGDGAPGDRRRAAEARSGRICWITAPSSNSP